jgi:hypothetical protein
MAISSMAVPMRSTPLLSGRAAVRPAPSSRSVPDRLLMTCGASLLGPRVLVLQPDFVMFEPAFPVVAGPCAGLVMASALRPGQGVGEWAGDRGGQVCQETADLRWCEADQAAWAFGA